MITIAFEVRGYELMNQPKNAMMDTGFGEVQSLRDFFCVHDCHEPLLSKN
jgi:hypothetical protein